LPSLDNDVTVGRGDFAGVAHAALSLTGNQGRARTSEWIENAISRISEQSDEKRRQGDWEDRAMSQSFVVLAALDHVRRVGKIRRRSQARRVTGFLL
jgi:hypothetical protein